MGLLGLARFLVPDADRAVRRPADGPLAAGGRAAGRERDPDRGHRPGDRRWWRWSCRSSSCSPSSPSKPASGRSAVRCTWPCCRAVATSPAQLVAANVTSSAAEGLGTFVGPALAGMLLVATGPLGADHRDLRDLRRRRRGDRPPARPGGRAVRHLGASRPRPALGRGRGAGRRCRGHGSSSSASGCRPSSAGLLTVLVVVAAIELLGHGRTGRRRAQRRDGAWAGSSERSRRSPWPVGTASPRPSGSPSPAGVRRSPSSARRASGRRALAMVAVGVSNAFIDVSGFTLIQRMTPNASRIAVLGLIDSVANGGVALGGVIAPVLIEATRDPRRADRERPDPARRRRPAQPRPCAGWTRAASAGPGGWSSSAASRCSRRSRWRRSSTWRRPSRPSPSPTATGSCARASPAWTTSSSTRAASRSRRTGRSSGPWAPAAASGRSRSCATCREPRPSARSGR